MVGTMYQIERIEAARSAKHIADLESELTALRKEVKPLVVAKDQLYHRCEASDAELASCKHLIGRVKYYVNELHDGRCHSLSQYVVGIDDINAVLNDSQDVEASNQTIEVLKKRIHELKGDRDSLWSKLALYRSVTPASIAERQKTITDLKDALSEENETIDDLGVKLEACKIDIKDRDNHIDELKDSHKTLRQQAANDEYTIKTLRAQLGFERNVVNDLRSVTEKSGETIRNNNNSMGRLHRTLKITEEDNNSLRTSNGELMDQINDLKTQVSERDDTILSKNIRHGLIESIVATDKKQLAAKNKELIEAGLLLKTNEETHESEFNLLALQDSRKGDKLKRISALLSDGQPHHHLTSRLSMISSIISEDIS